LDEFTPAANVTNCADCGWFPPPGSLRCIRGGYFGSIEQGIRTNLRDSAIAPGDRNFNGPIGDGGGLGFRCARVP
jgi:hypothetical protein